MDYIIQFIFQGICGTSIGLIISAVCETQQDATQIALGIFYPNLILSGIIWPIESMPIVLRYLSVEIMFNQTLLQSLNHPLSMYVLRSSFPFSQVHGIRSPSNVCGGGDAGNFVAWMGNNIYASLARLSSNHCLDSWDIYNIQTISDKKQIKRLTQTK